MLKHLVFKRDYSEKKKTILSVVLYIPCFLLATILSLLFLIPLTVIFAIYQLMVPFFFMNLLYRHCRMRRRGGQGKGRKGEKRVEDSQEKNKAER